MENFPNSLIRVSNGIRVQILYQPLLIKDLVHLVGQWQQLQLCPIDFVFIHLDICKNMSRLKIYWLVAPIVATNVEEDILEWLGCIGTPLEL